jgi:hypothetical protein
VETDHSLDAWVGLRECVPSNSGGWMTVDGTACPFFPPPLVALHLHFTAWPYLPKNLCHCVAAGPCRLDSLLCLAGANSELPSHVSGSYCNNRKWSWSPWAVRIQSHECQAHHWPSLINLTAIRIPTVYGEKNWHCQSISFLNQKVSFSDSTSTIQPQALTATIREPGVRFQHRHNCGQHCQ